MVQTQFFYRKDTLQICAVYQDCTTESTVFKDPAKYVEINVVDPPYPVTRDHRVVLDAKGDVAGTEPSVNPVQPKPALPEAPAELAIKSPDGSVWILTVDNAGKISGKKRRI